MCFGAKNDSYGTFNIQKTGTIFAFKLAHLSGGVTCSALDSITKWGCGVYLRWLNTVLAVCEYMSFAKL